MGGTDDVGRDRKRLLRLLIRDITVTRGPEPKRLCLNLRWQGGATETLELALPPRRADVVRYPQPFITRLRSLAETLDDRAIADRLDAEGLKSSTGKRFTVSMIRWLRYRHRIPAPAAPEGTLSVRQVRERYGVSLGSLLDPARSHRGPAVPPGNALCDHDHR